MSLTGAGFLAVTVALAVITLAACVPWEQRARWRVLGLGVAGATVTTVAAALVVSRTGLADWGLPWTFDIWFGLVVLGVTLGIAAWRWVRLRRLVPVAAVAATALLAGTLVNAHYGYYPTLSTVFAAPTHQVTAAWVTHEQRVHAHVREGVVEPVDIPGTVSHFHARTAWVWLPPAYVDGAQADLPVLELLPGSPSTPTTWVQSGGANATADAYAARHSGLAPLVVMPDSNGSLTADSECVDGPDGRVETYLTVDVPAFMHRVFDSQTGPRSMAVAGLSEGGMCAAELALRHPTEYAAFGDYSGIAAPSVRDVVAPETTTAALFHGSTAAYEAHDPANLLRHRHFPMLSSWYESGGEDGPAMAALTELSALSRAAGLTVRTHVVPGQAHSFIVWREALQSSFPFLTQALRMPAAA
ncbi:alpha/beta hydrolase [Jatrophihabitans sp. YIM 134969]